MSGKNTVFVLITTRSDFLGTMCDPSSLDVQDVQGVYSDKDKAEAHGKHLLEVGSSWSGPTSFDVEEFEIDGGGES